MHCKSLGTAIPPPGIDDVLVADDRRATAVIAP
jgi:hypothetical protein